MAQSNTAFAWSAPTGFAESNQLMATDWTSPDLDALVAAPAHHRLLFEHDRVRVLDTRIDPGDRTPLHTHRWPASHYVLSWSDFVRRDADGEVLVDTRQGPRTAPPLVVWGEPLPPHSLENVGAAPIHIISTELKDRTDAEQARMAALSVSKQT